MMTSILDKQAPLDIGNIFMQLANFDRFVEGANLNYFANVCFWIFIVFAITFAVFLKGFQTLLKSSQIKYYKRKQFARAFWNIAFYAACWLFLHFYNKFIILPQLKNQGRYSLFYSSENLIFHQTQQCEKFQLFSIFIITFHLHSATLDCKEADYLEAATKTLYLLSLVAIEFHKYENYFVGLNLNLSIYNIITECLFLLALQNSNRNHLIYQIFLGLRIASWSHMFISLIPFKYLVPTLFAKNFKLILNIIIWLWYGLSIWTSPVLQYFYHQIYHNSPTDCLGEGSAAKCILLRDSTEYRHYKILHKAFLEVKLAQEKNLSSKASAPTTESSSVKAFHAIKCIMTLKRKLKRIREGKNGGVLEDEVEDTPIDE